MHRTLSSAGVAGCPSMPATPVFARRRRTSHARLARTSTRVRPRARAARPTTSQGLLDLHRRDGFAASLDDLLRPAGDVEPARLAEVAQVAGDEPALAPGALVGVLGLGAARQDANSCGKPEGGKRPDLTSIATPALPGCEDVWSPECEAARRNVKDRCCGIDLGSDGRKRQRPQKYRLQENWDLGVAG